MQLIVLPDGTVRCLYTESVDLAAIGHLRISRASQVEPDSLGQWWAYLAPVFGPLLGPFGQRSAALAAEREWLEQNRLS